MSLNKNNIRIITGIVSGHCKLNYHLNKIGVIPNKECRFCRSNDETVEHVLGACPALMHIRRKVFGKYMIPDNELKLYRLGSILSFLQEAGLRELL